MATTQTAIFAAGCFWGVQAYFDQVPGVTKTVVGYTGGHTEHPTYEQVCMHTTGHAEACQIEFNPGTISYGDMVRQFFRMHDPTQVNRQGADVGDNYRSAIFTLNDDQRSVAEEVRGMAQKQFNKPIATQITAAGTFYPAEEYHQKFFEKTGIGACHVAYAPLAKT
ncbi:MAG TPA: peptide-methionine (S)-S-oxide reductase MsrA [Candidatus Saccharimonadales bacterium]|nr:peptide-methionine (S)-S-oxide reductase MsrA [Candidatus Saccharimonadales bacterium]